MYTGTTISRTWNCCHTVVRGVNKQKTLVNDGGSIYKILFSICWSKMSTVNSVSGFLGIILHFNLQIVLASGRVSALKINLLSLFPKRTNRKDDFNKRSRDK